MEKDVGLFGELKGLAQLVGIGDVAKLVGEAAVETVTGKPIANERKELPSHAQAYAEKQYQLAMVTTERKQAMALLLDAAQLGHIEAQYQLGVQHQLNFDEINNAWIAANWYRRAAEQGHAMAQFSLAEMYHNGEGVNHDNKHAVKWYLLAAQKGLVEAQSSLAHMYVKGFGVNKDLPQAIFWYQKAAAQGDNNALDYLSRLR
ncbi:TPR repeat protein [Aeromonas hydrophila]|uniref:tetratricopeptide repeat protein n=1 Tax=Aeromonas hydrophila TaxID=644 RepID=UPI0021696772|nr:tetratricopeptide repeat protein [Aeromonas hydrophila]MCS3770396.1 TPR repeat protein [Aeromonas hydrophila]